MKKYLLPLIIILCLVIVAYAADLFSDGFESGNLTAWTGSETGGGDLSAYADAKLHGNYGLKCVINDTGEIYVYDGTPATETRYRCRFYFDPNGLTMAANDEFTLFSGMNEAWTAQSFLIILIKDSGVYKIYVADRTDGTWAKATALYTITDEPHCIEVDWKASTGAGQNNGQSVLIIDGVTKETLTGIDSDTENVGYAVLGAAGIDAGTSGTFYLDDFASNDDGSEIGEISEGGTSILYLLGDF